MFIRVKSRKLKPDKTGRARESWDFRLVESYRLPGVAGPRQRVVASLGSFLPEPRGGWSGISPAVVDRFLASLRVKLAEVGAKPTPALLRPVEERLARLPIYPRPAGRRQQGGT